MSFSFPWVLVLLPAALLLLRRRTHRPIQIASLAGWKGAPCPRRVKWLPLLTVFRTVAAALLIVALAGPRADRPVSEEVRQGIAIQLLVDISSSMDQSIAGRDGQRTTRMAAVRETVAHFIQNRPDDLIGLITFARYADTLSPLTSGQDALIELVHQITIQDRPNEDGTAYGDALMIACARLDQMEDWGVGKPGEPGQNPAEHIESKIVILLTDGENNCGRHLPQEAAALAIQWGIRLYAVNIADAAKPHSGAAAVDEWTEAERLLDRITQETGGRFWRIHDASELDETYETIDQLEKSEIKTATMVRTEYSDISAFFILFAFLLLLLEQLLAATALRVAEEPEPLEVL